MSETTVLNEIHRDTGARMVDFSGWDMPLHYGSQIEEHKAVRENVGIFDVSHMAVVDVMGEDATLFLRHVLANDVSRLASTGAALYSVMLNEQGGIIDDLIVYRLLDRYRMVVNCATRHKDLDWLSHVAMKFSVSVEEHEDQAIIAVQGPNAVRCLQQALPELEASVDALRPFSAIVENGWTIGRTGYTGEDGFECILPETEAVAFWQALRSAGARPCGLAARDSLRLEAGLNLYGTDMDDSVSPLECGLGWTIAWEPTDRHFIGREALEMRRASNTMRRVGLVLGDRSVMRNGQVVRTSAGEGVITSGTFSPQLGCSVALARIPQCSDREVIVSVRNRDLKAAVVEPPFIRRGEILVPPAVRPAGV